MIGAAGQGSAKMSALDVKVSRTGAETSIFQYSIHPAGIAEQAEKAAGAEGARGELSAVRR